MWLYTETVEINCHLLSDPCDFNPERHWHRSEPHHALHLRWLTRILRLELESLQDSGEKQQELRACQMLAGTGSLANRERDKILASLDFSMASNESFRSELASSAPLLAL